MADYASPGDDAGDDAGDDVLGFRNPFRRRRRSKALGPARPFAKPPLPNRGFQPNVSRLRSYMGFGIQTWAVADATDKPIIVEPQESFRGERLVIDTSLAAGITNAPLILMRRIDIGTLPQSPSVEQPAPAAMFARDATYSALDLQIAYRATKVQITLGISAAPTGAGVATAAVGMYGEWIR